MFYPRGLRQEGWLPFYATQFQVVEINNTFYRLPRPETFARWAEVTPPDFLFAPKMSRFLTHVRRLREPREPVERFLEAASPLGAKLGPILLQLPPTLPADTSRLKEALEAFPAGVRLAVEPRHESWDAEEVRDLLSANDVALCLADRGGEPVTPLWQTASWGYVRLHHGTGSPPSCYEQRELESWARRIADRWDPEADVFVFFNNDAYGCAVRDARGFAGMLSQIGLRPSRVPAQEAMGLSGSGQE